MLKIYVRIYKRYCTGTNLGCSAHDRMVSFSIQTIQFTSPIDKLVKFVFGEMKFICIQQKSN